MCTWARVHTHVMFAELATAEGDLQQSQFGINVPLDPTLDPPRRVLLHQHQAGSKVFLGFFLFFAPWWTHVI